MEGGLGISVSTMRPSADVVHELPLHRAVVEGDLTTVTALLDVPGADPNQRDAEKNSPLHFAADRGFLAIAELLLRRGADVLAEDSEGNTPLSLARLCEHEELVLLLEEHSTRLGSLNR